MKPKTIRILKYACLAIYCLIVINVLVYGIKHGPPPVPLDPEGHMAPYYETSGWAFDVGMPKGLVITRC